MTLIQMITYRWYVLSGETGGQDAGGGKLLNVDFLLLVRFLDPLNKLTFKN